MPARFRQGAVLDAVAAGADRHDLDRARLAECGMGGNESGAHQLGLLQRERAAAGAEAQG
jgi:hypothetical protein